MLWVWARLQLCRVEGWGGGCRQASTSQLHRLQGKPRCADCFPPCPAPAAQRGEELLFVLPRDAATRSPRPQHSATELLLSSFLSFVNVSLFFFFKFFLSKPPQAPSNIPPRIILPLVFNMFAMLKRPFAPSQPSCAPAFFSWLSFWIVGAKSGHASSYSIHFHTFDSTLCRSPRRRDSLPRGGAGLRGLRGGSGFQSSTPTVWVIYTFLGQLWDTKLQNFLDSKAAGSGKWCWPRGLRFPTRGFL